MRRAFDTPIVASWATAKREEDLYWHLEPRYLDAEESVSTTLAAIFEILQPYNLNRRAK